jgi:hypothetical protein
MSTPIGAVWSARANNPYYRIRELALPASASTGLQRFEFRTTFLPHSGGQLLVQCQETQRRLQMIAGEVITFESGTEAEIVNTTDGELRFTVTEFK